MDRDWSVSDSVLLLSIYYLKGRRRSSFCSRCHGSSSFGIFRSRQTCRPRMRSRSEDVPGYVLGSNQKDPLHASCCSNRPRPGWFSDRIRQLIICFLWWLGDNTREQHGGEHHPEQALRSQRCCEQEHAGMKILTIGSTYAHARSGRLLYL